VVTILPVNWAIYAALAVGFLAVAAGLVFLVVRVLKAWRAFKRLRRHLGRELERLADLGERTAESTARALDTSELDASVARVRAALARVTLLREAIDEATGTFGRFAAVYPRK
jgi:uncharacterized membrane protein YcjF (UPF0283 family)